MRTFDQSLLELVASGVVTETQAMDFATDGHDFRLALDQAPLPLESRNSAGLREPAGDRYR